MILPALLRREDLELLVAGIVRQYDPEFQPGEVDLKALQISLKNLQSHSPQASSGVDAIRLGVLRLINRAALNRGSGNSFSQPRRLLACRSLYSAISVLSKMSGQRLPHNYADRVEVLRDNPR